MVVIVRQRGDRSRASGYAWISANPTDSEEMIAVADTREHRLQIEDSGFKPAVPPWFSAAARPTKQDSGWVQARGV
jgi:hypothetical protein